MLSLSCLVAVALVATPAKPIGTPGTPGGSTASAPRAAVTMKKSMSEARERLLPDILNALDNVSQFIVEADADRQRKPSVPTVAHIEAYCEAQQKKIDLLKAEIALMNEGSTDENTKTVRWTDIDGNAWTDAPWLK